MNKLNKILLIIIVILTVLLIFSINRCFYFAKSGDKAIIDVMELIEVNNKLENDLSSLKEDIQKDSEYSYETSIIYEEAGIKVTSDDEGFYTVTDTINNKILKKDFKIEMNDDWTYKVIER